MTHGIPLGPGGEFDRIRKIVDALGSAAGAIGDDAAILAIPNGHKLVASTDTSVENVHFKRTWLSFEEIGYRATAAALSDLAAMAATPLGVLLAISLPASDANELEAIAKGAGAAARDCGTTVIGGDLSSALELSITATVLGSAPAPLSRSGASPNSFIYLTGELGGAALALSALQNNAKPSAAARRKFAAPAPRLREAIWLRDQGATACIDVSDGIAGDLGHIAAASGVNLVIDAGSIPLFDGATRDIALSSGEEYELCVASPVKLDTARFRNEFGLPLTLIGRAEASSSPVVTFQSGGAAVQAPQSFSHFSK
jgi:thiamine-monophosphate kinase